MMGCERDRVRPEKREGMHICPPGPIWPGRRLAWNPSGMKPRLATAGPRAGPCAGPLATNIALLILGAGLLLFARQLISEHARYHIGFSGVSGWSAILYGLAVIVILTRLSNRYTLGLILAIAIACRFVTVFSEPFLSSDIYRYAWDGVVQHAGISPYRYVPGDPALGFLRRPNQDLYSHINRRDTAPTIYPPGAQVLFYAITWLNPTVTAMKLAMVLFEGLTLYALLCLLRELGRPREQVLLYAWCPLLVWEIGCAGHLDSAAMALIALALLARLRDQPVRTGVFLGLAVMTKLYPIVLLPALFRRGEYRMFSTLATVVALGYAAYSSVGLRVFGYLGGYAREEGLESGSRFFLLALLQRVPGLHRLPVGVYGVVAAGLLGALAMWCWRTCCNPARDGQLSALTRRFRLPSQAAFLPQAAALAFALMLLFSPRYPWYVAWLVPFFALLPSLPLFAYICGVFYLYTTALAVGYGPRQFLQQEILYGLVLAAFLIEAAQRFASGRRPMLQDAREVSP